MIAPRLTLLAVTLALAACGGGSSGGGAPTSSAKPPAKLAALDLSGWTKVADENGSFTLDGPTLVQYGTDGAYASLTLSGAVQCDNATFGDPRPGLAKACYTVAAAAAVPPVAVAAPPPAAPGSVADLEATGQLPVLDRSATMTGVDANGNGIRDDIDKWIAQQPFNDGQRRAAEQMARAMQATLTVDVTDRKTLLAVDTATSDALNCLHANFDAKEARKVGFKIEAYNANTRDRTIKYIKYSQALSGGVYQLSTGDTCAK